jgi:Zn-dependent protease
VSAGRTSFDAYSLRESVLGRGAAFLSPLNGVQRSFGYARPRMSSIPEFLVWYLVFVFSTTCHEAAHALAAMKGGDNTAYSMGQVTLDPIPHIKREPFGMVIMPILSFQMGMMVGWASTPYDPAWGSRYPRRWALMSFAGPLTNFSLAGLALIALRSLDAAGILHLSGQHGTSVGLVQLPVGHEFSSPLGALALALTALLKLNVLLGVYNLIPVPPLDGAAVVQGFAPPGVQSFYERIRQSPVAQIAGLLGAWWVFPIVFVPVWRVVRALLYS